MSDIIVAIHPNLVAAYYGIADGKSSATFQRLLEPEATFDLGHKPKPLPGRAKENRKISMYHAEQEASLWTDAKARIARAC